MYVHTVSGAPQGSYRVLQRNRDNGQTFHYLQDENTVYLLHHVWYQWIVFWSTLSINRKCFKVTLCEFITSSRVLSCIRDVLSLSCLTRLIVFLLTPVGRIWTGWSFFNSWEGEFLLFFLFHVFFKNCILYSPSPFHWKFTSFRLSETKNAVS